MNLKILVPHQIFADEASVLHIIAESPDGSFGLLPHRRDCVTALVPGILEYETEAGEVFVAIDGGMLVKSGPEVRVSVRRAVAGDDLARLRAAIERDFATIDAQEQTVRSVMTRLETGFLERFASLRHG